jgi:hypothetical protein
MPPQSLPALPDNYIVLHVGASSATRFWPAAHWQALADAIRAAQLSVVWSCGPGEDALLREIDPPAGDVRMAGCLSLLQLASAAGRRARLCLSGYWRGASGQGGGYAIADAVWPRQRGVVWCQPFLCALPLSGGGACHLPLP